MPEHLFSYGTLQKDKTQLDLFGRLLKGSKDVLKGYKLSPIEITDEKFLAKGEEKSQLTVITTNNQTDSIEGTALEITEEELLCADKYEPANYKRVKGKTSIRKRSLDICGYLKGKLFLLINKSE